jgi:Holliday junction DNA helicase RuvA
VVLDVGGVGYRVFAPLTTLAGLPAEGEEALLHTATVVREDDISLYGFRTIDDLQVFNLLTLVNGVGPKVALNILSLLDVNQLSQAISTSDVRTITRVPGVGQKLAQRLILELGEKLTELAFAKRVDALVAKQQPGESEVFADLVEALVNLGYSRADSRKAAELVISRADDPDNISKLIMEANNLLASHRSR